MTDAPGESRSVNDWANVNAAERYHSSTAGARQKTSGCAGVLTPVRDGLFAGHIIRIMVAIGVELLVSSRQSPWDNSPGSPSTGRRWVAVLWLAMLALRGTYDQRIIGTGTEELRRVVSSARFTLAIVAGINCLVRAAISRAYAVVSLPQCLIIIERFAGHR